MKKIIIAYVPVLHEGYRKFFEKHADAEVCYIIGQSLIEEFDHLAKEIRALAPGEVKKAVESWDIFSKVEILESEKISDVALSAKKVVLPNVLKRIWDRYFPKAQVILDPVFLRWDKHNTVTENPISPDVEISQKDFDKKMIALTVEEAEKSSDWWRRIGSVVVKDGKIILKTYNRHLPSEHTPYANGDPRNNFHKGVHLELGTSIHSEAGAIAEAAKKGISLEGAEIYVTTFPCPPCAKLIAYSGIKKLYYKIGYGVLDAEGILKQSGVEITQVVE